MKKLVLGLVFNFCAVCVAAQPPDAGHFAGLAFSGATLRQKMEINGGRLVNCGEPKSQITRCQVENGSLRVEGNELSELVVNFERVAVLEPSKNDPSRHYYFKGSTEISFGKTMVKMPVEVILNAVTTLPDRVRGFIDLADVDGRTSFEAYRVP